MLHETSKPPFNHSVNFKAVFESTPGVHVLLLPDSPRFTIITVSDDHFYVSGKTREELVGLGLFEAFPPNVKDASFDGDESLGASFQYVIKNKKPHRLPVQRYDLKNENGEFEAKYWSATNKPVLDQDGNLLYIIHSAEDITSRIRASLMEDEIKDMRQVHDLFMQTPIAIAILKGTDLIVELANKPIREVWAKNIDPTGKPIKEILPEIEEQGLIEKMNEVILTAKPFRAYEMPIDLVRFGKKETLFFNFVYQPYYEHSSNSPVGIVIFANDVTKEISTKKELALKEESLKLAIEISNLGVFSVDIDQNNFLHSTTHFSLQASTWFGLNGQHPSIEEGLSCIHPDDIGRVTDAIQRSLEGLNEGRHDLVYRIISKSDGQIRHIHSIGQAQFKDGKPIFISGILQDKTAEIIAHQKIIESEASLRNTILQAPVAMCILRGASFVVEIANERMFELWGKGENELLNKPIFEGLPEAKHQGFEELLHHVFTTGETFTANEQPTKLPRNGTIDTVYVNFVYEPFKEGDGKITGVIAVAIDVTDQVRARLKVAESEERFRTLANSIVQLAWMADADGWIHWYNDRWYQYTGTTLEEMQGWGWEKVHHPDHIESVIEFAKKAWNTDEPWELIFPLRRHDGQYRWFLTRGVPVKNKEGKVVQWIGTNTDIDEQKQTEALLEDKVLERARELESQRNLFDNILKNSSNGISVTEMMRDDDGNIIDAITILANDAAVRFTGLPKDVYLSKTAKELDPNILTSPYGQTCLKTLATGEPSFIQYYLEVSGRWLELTISKMDDDHLIHIFTDVTPIKEAQLKLERTVEELQRSNENLQEFAYAASHDLKEPIRKIHFFSDRLRNNLRNKLSEEDVNSFHRMELAARRMSSLIDDLLNYSQIGFRPDGFENVSLNGVINQVLSDLDLEIERKSAVIHVDNLGSVEGYQHQLQQAFQNLVANALKYTREGVRPEIRITGSIVNGKDTGLNITAEECHKDFYRIEVTDNGIGFDQKDAERIFNVFTRLHGNGEFKGTGVGLSIVRKVIENHNGYIMAESTPGHGSTFKVYLPLQQS